MMNRRTDGTGDYFSVTGCCTRRRLAALLPAAVETQLTFFNFAFFLYTATVWESFESKNLNLTTVLVTCSKKVDIDLGI